MKRRNGFTLVELVVVILILGILAGVAAPKMFSTSEKAKDSGLQQSLGVIRDAIELYYSQNGTYPTCNATASDFKLQLKGYIRGPFPASPVGASPDAEVKPTTTTPLPADGSTGWMYNTTTGEFICNDTGLSLSGTPFNEL